MSVDLTLLTSHVQAIADIVNDIACMNAVYGAKHLATLKLELGQISVNIKFRNYQRLSLAEEMSVGSQLDIITEFHDLESDIANVDIKN